MHDRAVIRSRARLALATLLLGPCPVAWAGPPFLTDDPEPVDLHHEEINLAWQQTRSDSGRAGTLAGEVNVGCAPETQCHVAVSEAFSQAPGAPARHGLGDAELGFKYRFLDWDDEHAMAAVYPTVYLPTGSAARGLGNGKAQVLLPLWLQRTAGPWRWDAGGGYLVNPAPGARSSWFTGVVGQRTFGDQLTLGVEVFHRTPVALGAAGTTGYDIGAILALGPHQNLLASLGRGLRNVEANRGSLYVAYQLEL